VLYPLSYEGLRRTSCHGAPPATCADTLDRPDRRGSAGHQARSGHDTPRISEKSAGASNTARTRSS